MHRILCYFLFFVYLAQGYDFSYCQKRYEEMTLKFNKNIYAVPIFYKNKTYFIMHSFTPLRDKKIIKHDPFVGLYLIESDKNVRGYLLRNIDQIALEIEVSVLNHQEKVPTKIIRKQNGFLDFAKLRDKSMGANQVVSNICYQIYGITTENGDFVTKPYIERFLSQDKPYYGDIGVRIQGRDIVQIDPFFPNNPFLPGDRIVKIGKQTLLKNVNLEWSIVNLIFDKPVEILVERKKGQKNITKSFVVNVDQRYGGFLLQDSFFESQGIKINKNLKIIRANDNLKNGLEKLNVGDKIVWIDKISPFDLEGDFFYNVRELLMRAFLKHGFIELLVDRNGFQFYLKVYPR
ncbi:hypothetical protein LW135_00135 [Helicobacter sp. faydin-H20]|uniref:DUF7488 domain-containing protein n=1 Tax=Helicobacter anatolicus TaxID=2905874 RepID=UPI001E436883|nr:hypothetical protein [Helicobacter anatolicus]MCE3036240.1 hypothetical protein [Helicobacter anatolicus]